MLCRMILSKPILCKSANIIRLLPQQTFRSSSFYSHASNKLRHFSRRKLRNVGAFSALATTSGITLVWIMRSSFISTADSAEKPASPRDRLNFFADLVSQVAPSVVFVQVSANIPFFGGHQHAQSGGSGLIVRSDGFILTNSHVVAHFQRSDITVTLNNGQKCKGRVVKMDRETDLAIVKVDGVHDLPVLPLADSSSVRPGEFVAALGSPFTLSNSVSMGIVSNPSRSLNDLGLSTPMQYVQTDAAINVGNSGGPLINLVSMSCPQMPNLGRCSGWRSGGHKCD